MIKSISEALVSIAKELTTYASTVLGNQMEHDELKEVVLKAQANISAAKILDAALQATPEEQKKDKLFDLAYHAVSLKDAVLHNIKNKLNSVDNTSFCRMLNCVYGTDCGMTWDLVAAGRGASSNYTGDVEISVLLASGSAATKFPILRSWLHWKGTDKGSIATIKRSELTELLLKQDKEQIAAVYNCVTALCGNGHGTKRTYLIVVHTLTGDWFWEAYR